MWWLSLAFTLAGLAGLCVLLRPVPGSRALNRAEEAAPPAEPQAHHPAG